MGGEPEDGVVEERTEMTEEDLVAAMGKWRVILLYWPDNKGSSQPKKKSSLLGQNQSQVGSRLIQNQLL